MKKYVGTTNNCSDFALFAVSKLLGSEDVYGNSLGKEEFWTTLFTTPNELFKDTRAAVKADAEKGKVLIQNANFQQPFISIEQSGGLGESSPDNKF